MERLKYALGIVGFFRAMAVSNGPSAIPLDAAQLLRRIVSAEMIEE